MRATTLTPRSWPSRPTLATRTRPCSGRPAVASLAIFVEPPSGLAAEQTGFDHARQHGRRSVERFLEFLVEALGDGERGVEADEVGEVERPHRVVAALDHAGVDVLGTREA